MAAMGAIRRHAFRCPSVMATTVDIRHTTPDTQAIRGMAVIQDTEEVIRSPAVTCIHHGTIPAISTTTVRRWFLTVAIMTWFRGTTTCIGLATGITTAINSVGSANQLVRLSTDCRQAIISVLLVLTT